MEKEEKMEKEERKSKVREMAEQGEFAAFYTLKGWFVKVSPAYGIDKVRVAFVQKGTSGKVDFEVYVPIPEFSYLCTQVKSFRMERLIAREHEAGVSNPECFKYVTGENGQKYFAVGSGMKPGSVVLQGKSGSQFANVACSYQDLWIMADWFFRTSEAWYKEMAKKIVTESERYHKEKAQEKAQEETASQRAGQKAGTGRKAQGSQAQKPKAESTEQQTTQKLTFNLTGQWRENETNYVFATQYGPLLTNKDVAKKLAWFGSFMAQWKNGNIHRLTCTTVKKDEKYYLTA